MPFAVYDEDDRLKLYQQIKELVEKANVPPEDCVFLPLLVADHFAREIAKIPPTQNGWRGWDRIKSACRHDIQHQAEKIAGVIKENSPTIQCLPGN